MLEKIRSWPRWLRWGIAYSLGPIILVILAILTREMIFGLGLLGFAAPLLLLEPTGDTLPLLVFLILLTVLIWFLIGAFLGDFVPARYSQESILGSEILYIMLFAYAISTLGTIHP